MIKFASENLCLLHKEQIPGRKFEKTLNQSSPAHPEKGAVREITTTSCYPTQT